MSKRHTTSVRKWLAVCLSMALVAVCLLGATATPARADDKPKIALPEGTCTNDPQFNIKQNQIISTIANQIAQLAADSTSNISGNMFSGAGGADGIGGSIEKMCELYIFFYGILFMFGVVQASIYEFISRLAKVAIVASLAGGGGQLNDLMQNFFEQGTYDMIIAVSGGSLPLDRVDSLVDAIVSPKMIVTVATIATTGFYGPFLFLIILASLQSLTGAILNAVWIFLMSQVVRGILYGVAPIFIACALFQRTRDFYQGWLNQLVNACLQPIFLFTFFSFFINLIGHVLENLMGTPICLTQMPETARGASINAFWWRFTVNNEQFDGPWGESTNFPVDIFQIFIFFVLAELVSRFSEIVVAAAKGISGASTNMARSALLSSWVLANSGIGGGEASGKGKIDVKPDAHKSNDAPGHPPAAPHEETSNVGKRAASGGQLGPRGKKGTTRDGSLLTPVEEEEEDPFESKSSHETRKDDEHSSPDRTSAGTRKHITEKIEKRPGITPPKGKDDK